MRDFSKVKALVFDVFGTVVDFRSSVIHEGQVWNEKKGIDVDWAQFVDEWRGQYRPSLNRVLRGEQPWMNLDALHMEALKGLLKKYEITSFSEEEVNELNKVWHRLNPWTDSVPGLERLKEKYIISPLSNGHIALLTNMAKHSGLPWDVILSPEIIQSYKPDPNVYLMAAELLGCKPKEVMMVAAHQHDLSAAKKVGLKTAYILRPLEFGYENIPDLEPTEDYDFVCNDIVDLARKLGV
jgi:2-haloacid dehalogenase